MSLGRSSSVASLALVALLAFGVAACDDDTATISIGQRDATTTSTSSADATTDAPTTTSAPDETTDSTEGAGDAGQSGSSADADEESLDDSWLATAREFRGSDGSRVAYTCPPNGTIGDIWGTGPFTDDSSVCTAAVFAGLITPEGGGRVVVEIAPGADSYAAGEGHGVTTVDYGVWAGSFTLVT